MASPAYATKAAGADVSRSAFGVNLTSQGRGYYVTLELMAIAWGTVQAGSIILPPFTEHQEGQDRLTYRRRSHDFARRIMAGDGIKPRDLEFLRGDSTESVLRELLSSLRVPIPNRRTMPEWGLQHLYPYVGELIHYDAVKRGSGVSIERYTYRGGGGLLHKILRTDPDAARLESNRSGLTNLIADAGGPLGQLALACASHDAEAEANFEDIIEPATVAQPSVWVDHIRTGTQNITSRASTTRSKKVEMLMHWLPYCLARYQLDRASQICSATSPVLPIAQLQRSGPIRRSARQELGRSRSLIDQALLRTSGLLAADLKTEDDRRQVLLNLSANRKWREPSLSFFTQTLATCGALNAHTGSRYLTMKLPLLEAMVCAALKPEETQEFEKFFFETLFGEFRLVFDKKSATSAGLIDSVDAGDFDSNAGQLASDLKGLGLLSEFSDATRIMHGEVR